MPEINFNKVDDVQDFSPKPEGVYPVEVIVRYLEVNDLDTEVIEFLKGELKNNAKN